MFLSVVVSIESSVVFLYGTILEFLSSFGLLVLEILVSEAYFPSLFFYGLFSLSVLSRVLARMKESRAGRLRYVCAELSPPSTEYI